MWVVVFCAFTAAPRGNDDIVTSMVVVSYFVLKGEHHDEESTNSMDRCCTWLLLYVMLSSLLFLCSRYLGIRTMKRQPNTQTPWWRGIHLLRNVLTDNGPMMELEIVGGEYLSNRKSSFSSTVKFIFIIGFCSPWCVNYQIGYVGKAYRLDLSSLHWCRTSRDLPGSHIDVCHDPVLETGRSNAVASHSQLKQVAIRIIYICMDVVFEWIS